MSNRRGRVVFRSSERWYLQVKLEVDGVQRSCMVGSLPTWTALRELADKWEREFGPGTVRLRNGVPARKFRPMPGVAVLAVAPLPSQISAQFTGSTIRDSSR